MLTVCVWMNEDSQEEKLIAKVDANGNPNKYNTSSRNAPNSAYVL